MRSTARRSVAILVAGCLIAVASMSRAAEENPVIINLYLDGAHPPTVEVPAGSAIRWLSHLTHTRYDMVTVTFRDGERVARATHPVPGYGAFSLNGNELIGRMQADAGQVALQFMTPGTYTYVVSHHSRAGTIVVR